MSVILTRNQTSDEGTFGSLFIGTEKFFTIELPWRDNHPNLSCIPAGTYNCRWRSSRSKGMCYHVEDVPGRSEILIHPANLGGDITKGFKSDLEGCIGLGMLTGFISVIGGKQRGVLNSKMAISLFAQKMEYQTFVLTVVGLI